MSVDLDRPSVAAADVIGLFRTYDERNGHPDGWSRAVVTKIHEDYGAGYYPTEADYSPEEMAAFRWYKQQIQPEAWKSALFEYRKAGSQQQTTPPEEWDPETARLETPNVEVSTPDVKPFAAESSRGGVAVNTEAIRHFCSSLAIIAPPSGGGGMLNAAVTGLESVRMLPGKFARAELMRMEIEGSPSSPGMRGATMAALAAVEGIFVALQHDLLNVVKKYDGGEELNALSVSDFTTDLRGSATRINRLGSGEETTT